MTLSIAGRSLHWVFKVADREATMDFFLRVLGMKVLRHEEFDQGCEAACNGPYDNKWSKTMVGYGPEDSHFVVELTYNYGIKEYKKGNDYDRIIIKSRAAYRNVKAECHYTQNITGPSVEVEAPGGYRFEILDVDVATGADPVGAVSINVPDLAKSLAYWHGVLGMTVHENSNGYARVGFGARGSQAELQLRQVTGAIDHAVASGRIAFSCPTSQLKGIQEFIDAKGCTTLTRLVSLPTPGKADVVVIILACPDGYEICFVGDEAFRELSAVDSKGAELLAAAMEADTSKAYFEKKAASAKARAEKAAAAQ